MATLPRSRDRDILLGRMPTRARGWATPVLASALLAGCGLIPGHVIVSVRNDDPATYTIQFAELNTAWSVGPLEAGVLETDLDHQSLLLVFDEDCAVVARYGIGPGVNGMTITDGNADLREANASLGGPPLPEAPRCSSW
jgi:hypothetical protein